MSQRRRETAGFHVMKYIDYKYLFQAWIKNERDKLRGNSRKSKGFVGDRPYRHFDGRIKIENLESNIAKIIPKLEDPELLVKHSFYPFIRKDKKFRLFQKKGVGQKVRPIMYASHADACIYSFYAYMLKQQYESSIKDTGLDQSVIAYRKMPRVDSPDRGKSNIDLAKDVFELTKKYKSCAVLCLDVEKFFDRMDHRLIKEKWCELLGESKLPSGHYMVFKNITNFRYVFLHEALTRLGYGKLRDGKFIYKPNKKKKGPLCEPAVFNKKIGPKKGSIIHKNRSGAGIPQGSPISDVLANMYLASFDTAVLDFLSQQPDCHYRRYSDDIIIICPVDVVQEVYDCTIKKIKDERLTIKTKKCEVLSLDSSKKTVKDITAEISKNTSVDTHRQSFQFLGFEMDTKDMHLRSGTVAAHYRKAKRRAQKRTSAKTSLRRLPKRNRHWQYLLMSQDKLQSQRVRKQVHKVLKRAKTF